jgi:hypothetical protein
VKSVVLGVSLAIVALLAWSWWPAAAVVPRTPVGGAVHDSSTPPVALPAMRPADEASVPDRVPVDAPTGPTEVQVTCVWANDGAPASSIPVVVFRIGAKAYVGPVATAATDAAGVVTFRKLSAGEHEFRAVRARARATATPGVRVETTLAVPELAVAGGIVVDAAGVPVADAAIVAEVDYIAQRIAVTGADGRFRVRLASRPIWASKEGHLPSRVHRFEGGGADIVLRLETAGGSLHGVVLDPDGRAVPHASVAIGVDLAASRGYHAATPHVMLEADARGGFATTQVPRRKVIVFAFAEEFAFGRQDVDTRGMDTNVVVRLRRAATIHGVLLGGNDGDEPLVGRGVSIHRPVDLPGLLKGTSDQLTRLVTGTDSRGRYRLSGIHPGRTWIMAGDTKGAPVFHSVLLREGQEYEWSPDLSRPAGRIRGVLQGPDGEPLAGLQVRATRVDPVQQKQELSRAETLADGRFDLTELRPFPHALTVHSSGASEPFAKRTEVAPDGPALVWRLSGLPSQSGAIVGRVLGPDGQPVAGVKCRARSEGILRNSEAVRDVPAGFRIPDLLPGTWHVTGQVEGYGSFDLGQHAMAANALVDLGTHPLPRGALRVRLSGRGFQPAGITLALEQVEGGTNKTAGFQPEAGALRSPALPPGRYRLLARGANFAPIPRDVTIPAGSDVAVDLEAEATATVAIEFVPEGLDGSDWTDRLTFELRDHAGTVVIRHALDSRGAPTITFTIGLAPGAYTIDGSSHQSAYRRGRTEFVVPADATRKLDVSVALEVQHR